MNILIVEDELVIAQRLERLIDQVAGDSISSIETCSTLEAARARLEQGAIDALFLDLNLNGHDGFELLADVTSGAFHTVVVSGHTTRALEAFEIGVLDFVAKPFGAERLAKTMARLHGARGEHSAAKLAVRTPGRIDLVPVDDLAYVRASGSYSELVLRDGSLRLHGKSLERLLALLPPVFERVHRSYILRVDEVVRIQVKKGSRYSAVLTSGEEIPVGRTRVEALRLRLDLP